MDGWHLKKFNILDLYEDIFLGTNIIIPDLNENNHTVQNVRGPHFFVKKIILYCQSVFAVLLPNYVIYYQTTNILPTYPFASTRETVNSFCCCSGQRQFCPRSSANSSLVVNRRHQFSILLRAHMSSRQGCQTTCVVNFVINNVV